MPATSWAVKNLQRGKRNEGGSQSGPPALCEEAGMEWLLLILVIVVALLVLIATG